MSFQIPRTVRPSPWEAHARDVADGSWEATRTRTKKAKSCSRAPGNTPRRRWSGFVRGRRSEPMHRRRPRWNWKPCDRLGRKHERSEKRKDGRFDGAALGVPARVGRVDETHVVETNGTWFFLWCGGWTHVVASTALRPSPPRKRRRHVARAPGLKESAGRHSRSRRACAFPIVPGTFPFKGTDQRRGQPATFPIERDGKEVDLKHGGSMTHGDD